MKTWEMIKELTENTEMRFKCINGCLKGIEDYIIGRNKEGYIKFLRNGEFRDTYFDIHGKFDWDWELVPQEVTWQEAVQAWVDGKGVYFTLNGRVRLYLDDCSHYLITFDGCRPISKDEISKAKWYIE